MEKFGVNERFDIIQQKDFLSNICDTIMKRKNKGAFE